MRPGGQIFTTDVCVPISRLAECIVATEKDVAASFLPALIVGHAGDGNFHLIIVVNPNEPMEMAEAERLNERLVTSHYLSTGPAPASTASVATRSTF